MTEYKDSPEEIKIVELPVYKWKVSPLPNVDMCMEERPCWWCRVWMRFFFGWVFKAL